MPLRFHNLMILLGVLCALPALGRAPVPGSRDLRSQSGLNRTKTLKRIKEVQTPGERGNLQFRDIIGRGPASTNADTLPSEEKSADKDANSGNVNLLDFSNPLFGNSENNGGANQNSAGGGLGNPTIPTASSSAGGGAGSARSSTPEEGAKSITIDDSAPKNRKKASIPPLLKDKHKTPPNNQTGGGGSQPQELPYWKPICFLMDPAISNANELIKGVVDHYATCGVVAEPYPFTIKQNYPERDPDLINEKAKQVCPLADTLGVNESSIQTHVNSDITTDIMCDQWKDKEKGIPDTATAGCAVLVPPRGGVVSQQDFDKHVNASKNSNSKHGSNTAADGKDAVSIVDRNQTVMVAVHELQHNAGGVNHGDGDANKDHGFGIESMGKKDGPRGGGNNFTSEGCAHLVAASNVNEGNHMYVPDREVYYVATENPIYDLMKGESFFGGGGDTPPPPTRPPPRQGDPPLPAPEKPRGVAQNNLGSGTAGHQDRAKPASSSAPVAIDSPDSFFGENASPNFASTDKIELDSDVPPVKSGQGIPASGPAEGASTITIDDEIEGETLEKGKAKAADPGGVVGSEGSRTVGIDDSLEGQTGISGGAGEATESEGGREIASSDEDFFSEGSGEEGFGEEESGNWWEDIFDGDFWAPKKPAATAPPSRRPIRVIKP